ncbi:MAG TPA: hypothetical protein VHQ41_01910 [Patescibacteria group bacterium]|jgi:hypothetical protein|nr:hypothetical protein [Patescibacteria group bacterium]
MQKDKYSLEAIEAEPDLAKKKHLATFGLSGANLELARLRNIKDRIQGMGTYPERTSAEDPSLRRIQPYINNPILLDSEIALATTAKHQYKEILDRLENDK